MRCAVLGSPVTHSLSPVMHRAAYDALELDWTYEAVDVPAGTLAAFLGALGDDVRGFSVTAPLKREAAAAAHRSSAVVELLGIANTLVVDEDERLTADNTDVAGTVAALAERAVVASTARILGGGATAASIAHAIAGMGVQHLDLVVRDEARAADTLAIARGSGLAVRVSRLDDPPGEPADLLISTIPVAAVEQHAEQWLAGASAVLDVVYDPWPTALVAAAQRTGVTVVSGLDLLAHQAAVQVQLMTGQPIAASLLRDAALAALTQSDLRS